jgi:hypothetical protein
VDDGAEGFAERARRELPATGETVRKRTDEARERPGRRGLQPALSGRATLDSAVSARKVSDSCR